MTAQLKTVEVKDSHKKWVLNKAAMFCDKQQKLHQWLSKGQSEEQTCS